MKKCVFFIVGPTAVGKTAVSLEVARELDAEIISADSRQIYRQMDIGTAKPAPGELRAVPHHFIDIRDPDEYYSSGAFGREARECVREIWTKRHHAMVVGGSGLYVRAMIDGFSGPAIADQEIKRDLRRRLEEEGLATLYAELQSCDPETAARLKPGDTQRIMRALEVRIIAGVPLSEHLRKPAQPADFTPVIAGLAMDRPLLYERINRRVDHMIAAGLVDEVKQLLERGYGLHLNSLRTVGYQEAIKYLQGGLSQEEMVKLIKQKTRNYAKRQMTWFRKDRRIRWFEVDADVLNGLAKSLVAYFRAF